MKKAMADLCDSVRHSKPSQENSNYYDFEYKMLMWANVDLNKDRASIVRQKMNKLWKERAKDLECKYATNLFPKGNFYRQFPHSGAKSIFLTVLKTYKLDPNIIDSDGCTVLDYLNKTINTYGYTKYQLDQFKEYRELLLINGAKTAKELGGKC